MKNACVLYVAAEPVGGGLAEGGPGAVCAAAQPTDWWGLYQGLPNAISHFFSSYFSKVYQIYCDIIYIFISCSICDYHHIQRCSILYSL